LGKTELILTVEYPPTANHMKMPVAMKTMVNGKLKWTARLITAPKGRAYFERVYRDLHGKIKTLEPPYDVLIEVHIPDLRKRDLINVEKASMDALDKAGIITDDSKINDIRLVRFPPVRPKGVLIVRIREVFADVGNKLTSVCGRTGEVERDLFSSQRMD